MIRVFWKIFDIHPNFLVPDGFQKIYRTDRGTIYSDSVGYDFQIPNKKHYTDQEIAYIDVQVVRENDNNVFYDYNLIQIDELDTDKENSNLITQYLGLNWQNNTPPYITNFKRGNGYRDDNLLQADLIPNYSVWCEIHNKLMISPAADVFPTYIYVGSLTNLYHTYPSKVASTWKRKWILIAKNNDETIAISSYRRYDTAEKVAKKYIKSLLNNRRLRNFPDFKRDGFTHDTGDGILTIKLVKEKELQ